MFLDSKENLPKKAQVCISVLSAFLKQKAHKKVVSFKKKSFLFLSSLSQISMPCKLKTEVMFLLVSKLWTVYISILHKKLKQTKKNECFDFVSEKLSFLFFHHIVIKKKKVHLYSANTLSFLRKKSYTWNSERILV